MTGEKKIVGLWNSQNSAPKDDDLPQQAAQSAGSQPDTADKPLHAECAATAGNMMEPAFVASQKSESLNPSDTSELEDPHSQPDKIARIGWVFAGATTIWAGFSLFVGSDAFSRLPTAAEWLSLITAITAPAAMLLILWYVLRHNGDAEQRRFGRLASALRAENAALNQSLTSMNSHLADAHRQLREQVHLVQQLGFDAALRLNESSDKLGVRINHVTEASTQLQVNTDNALQRMDGLLSGLPRIDDVATRLASNFREAGLVAHQQGAQLEAHLASLGEEAARAAYRAEQAATELDKALNNLRSLTEDTQNGLVAAADKVADTQSQTLSAMSRGTAVMRQDLQETTDKLSENIENLWKKFRTEIEDSASLLGEELRKADEAGSAINTSLDQQKQKGSALSSQMAAMLDETREQLSHLNAAVDQSSEHIERAVDHSKTQLAAFSADMGVGNRSAQQLITHSEALLLALDAVARELDETLPLAFERLKSHENSAQQSAARLKPLLEASELVAQSTLSHIHSAEKSLESNDLRLKSLADQHDHIQSKAEAAFTQSEQSLQQLKQVADEFSEQSAAQMLAAISRVQDMAELVTSEVRANFGAISEESRNALHGHAVSAIDEAFRAEMIAQLEAIELASHRAVTAANSATDRLTRQLHSIVEASEAVESRTSEAEQAIIAFDRDTLAKQVGLLTEALKSTAIDMTKILSSEVSDVAWEAYLRGDRGIFARRAVKLVDHGEAREILRLYQNDTAFHGSVNQFIHDFEAMLRLLMNARDGSSISVTLLSSDIGKLYVVLAQAIDRLRN